MKMSEWLFVCDLSEMKVREQSKFFRDIKGYRYTEKRTEKPKVYEKKGLIDEYDSTWLGSGNFMVRCTQKDTFVIINKLNELRVKYEMFKCTPIVTNK